ncbi:lmo0937 family membrane protein [Patescibacteria group bacterium]|nr:lmo0937 family membrane protein [Patescibacteria group bacterium]
MLITIAVILLILWFIGVLGAYTLGSFVHLLLVLAIIMVLIRIIRGENPVKNL